VGAEGADRRRAGSSAERSAPWGGGILRRSDLKCPGTTVTGTSAPRPPESAVSHIEHAELVA
jgi:hypothetical protein